MRGKVIAVFSFALLVLLFLSGLWATENTLWSRKVGGVAIAAERPPKKVLGSPATRSEDLAVRPPKVVLGSFSEDFQDLSTSRKAAVAYAWKYWNRTCSCGYSYGDSGGDCAHFVSHCLLAGGLDNRGRGLGWKGNEKIIVGCPKLYQWLVLQHGTVVSSIRELEPGDVIFYGSGPKHVALYIGEGKVSGHNENLWGENYQLGYRNLKLVHLKYPQDR